MSESLQYFKDGGFEIELQLIFFVKIIPFNKFNIL